MDQTKKASEQNNPQNSSTEAMTNKSTNTDENVSSSNKNDQRPANRKEKPVLSFANAVTTPVSAGMENKRDVQTQTPINSRISKQTETGPTSHEITEDGPTSHEIIEDGPISHPIALDPQNDENLDSASESDLSTGSSLKSDIVFENYLAENNLQNSAFLDNDNVNLPNNSSTNTSESSALSEAESVPKEHPSTNPLNFSQITNNFYKEGVDSPKEVSTQTGKIMVDRDPDGPYEARNAKIFSEDWRKRGGWTKFSFPETKKNEDEDFEERSSEENKGFIRNVFRFIKHRIFRIKVKDETPHVEIDDSTESITGTSNPFESIQRWLESLMELTRVDSDASNTPSNDQNSEELEMESNTKTDVQLFVVIAYAIMESANALYDKIQRSKQEEKTKKPNNNEQSKPSVSASAQEQKKNKSSADSTEFPMND